MLPDGKDVENFRSMALPLSSVMCNRAEASPLVLFSIKILQSLSPIHDTKSDDREAYSFLPDRGLQSLSFLPCRDFRLFPFAIA